MVTQSSQMARVCMAALVIMFLICAGCGKPQETPPEFISTDNIIELEVNKIYYSIREDGKVKYYKCHGFNDEFFIIRAVGHFCSNEYMAIERKYILGKLGK